MVSRMANDMEGVDGRSAVSAIRRPWAHDDGVVGWRCRIGQKSDVRDCH